MYRSHRILSFRIAAVLVLIVESPAKAITHHTVAFLLSEKGTFLFINHFMWTSVQLSLFVTCEVQQTRVQLQFLDIEGSDIKLARPRLYPA